MPHKRLKRLGGHRLGVHRGKIPAKVVKPVYVAGWGVLVIHVTWQANASRPLDPSEFFPQRTGVVIPGKHERGETHDLTQVLYHEWVQWNDAIAFPPVIRRPRDRRAGTLASYSADCSSKVPVQKQAKRPVVMLEKAIGFATVSPGGQGSSLGSALRGRPAHVTACSRKNVGCITQSVGIANSAPLHR